MNKYIKSRKHFESAYYIFTQHLNRRNYKINKIFLFHLKFSFKMLRTNEGNRAMSKSKSFKYLKKTYIQNMHFKMIEHTL